MKNRIRRKFYPAICMLAAFVLWTAALQFVDIQTIGPLGSSVGFGTMNGFFHSLIGVHMPLYLLTDWLGLIPLCFMAGFGGLGLIQWIRRKQLWKVDGSILLLGGFYVLVMAAYLLFEIFAVNYRPVLIGGNLEVSYPSSTTMLVLCVMPTASMQLCGRIQNRVFRRWIFWCISVFTVLMVVGRLISGVHWFSDIVGGIFLSAGLVLLYRAFSDFID